MNKKYFKSLFTLLLVAIFAFTLAACGDKDQEAVDAALDNVSIVFASGDNANSVTQNLNLPTKVGDITIAWASSNTQAISNSGAVTRGFNNVNVILTATLTFGDAEAKKEFVVVVKQLDVNAALNAITITGDFELSGGVYHVAGNLTLPSTVQGMAITWVSTQPNVITNSGVVTQPAYGQPDANVLLIASINNVEREFNMLVPAITEKPAILILNEASDVLLIPGTSDGVAANLTLPSKAGADEIPVTWTSSNPAVISNSGVVSRGEENVTVIMTATLTYGGQSVTKDFELVVIAAAEYQVVDSIAHAMEISRSGEDLLSVTRKYVRVNGVTIIGITGDGFVFADDTGIMFAYTGSRWSNIEIGKVYDIRGLTDRYLATWQFNHTASVATPIILTPSEEAPYFPEPIEVASVTDMLANHWVPTPSNPDIVFAYYRLTAQIRVQNVADNYGTVFVDPDYDGPNILTAANTPHKDNAVIVYYHSNKAAFNALNGLVATFNVLFYGYRTDRLIFSTLYLETLEDIELDLTDAELVDVAENFAKSKVDAEYVANATIALPTDFFGANIAWASDKENLINPTTGAVTIPAVGQEEVTLTVTITKGEVSKVVTIKVLVGLPELIDIADAFALPAGSKVRIQGVVTGIVSNGTFAIQDETGALAFYALATGQTIAKWQDRVGKVVEIIGTRSDFNGLRQINIQKDSIIGDGTMPEVVSVNGVALTTEGLLQYQNQFVSRDNLLVTNVAVSSNGNITLTLKDVATDQTIQLRWDARIAVTGGNIADVAVDDVINLVGVAVAWFNGPQFGYTGPNQIVIVE